MIIGPFSRRLPGPHYTHIQKISFEKEQKSSPSVLTAFIFRILSHDHSEGYATDHPEPGYL